MIAETRFLRFHAFRVESKHIVHTLIHQRIEIDRQHLTHRLPCTYKASNSISAVYVLNLRARKDLLRFYRFD